MRERILPLALLLGAAAYGNTVSTLFAHGYTVIPQPQQVALHGGDFALNSDWRVSGDANAAAALTQGLQERVGVHLSANGSKTISLVVARGLVNASSAQDRDRAALAEQAYSLTVRPDRIDVKANAPAGLFYGVQTLLQLASVRQGAAWLPEADIVDWPDLARRHIYWDDAHHLDRLDELKRAIRQAAFFKINGFIIKLEGHFQYKSAPALVEPYALTPAEFQELTDYGRRFFVQVIPYLDAPAHVAFILKHPEYAPLRAFPDNNYEMCATNPASLKLMTSLFQDLLDANRGATDFYLSTDEPYYVGQADNAQCREAGSQGKVLAEFINKTANYLHEHGRTVMFWGESPLTPADIPLLPKHLINGEVYGPKFDPVFKAHGIRQMIYTSTEGEEKLFPDYFALPASQRLHPVRSERTKIESMHETIAANSARKDADLAGVVIAGWADMGLHPETFWLGYATGPAYGWNPRDPAPREAMSAFFRLFYGAEAAQMDRVYQLMCRQAQFWDDSWDTGTSTARKPIWGNSFGRFATPHPAHDQSLPLPPAPSADLARDSSWSREQARRIELAGEFSAENDELQGLLLGNLARVSFNRYNLEVLLSITQLCRQNLNMIRTLADVDRSLDAARTSAAQGKDKAALASLDRALAEVRQIWTERNAVLRNTKQTWQQSWLPRVAEANGRRFVHEVDDVKDHLPDRTVDMRYLVYRELLAPLGDWSKSLLTARNQYAAAHGQPSAALDFDWSDVSPAGL